MDSALTCLAFIARLFQLPIEPENLRHEFASPGELFSDVEILRAAKHLNLKAKKFCLPAESICKQLLPAIAKARDGSYFIIASVAIVDTAVASHNSGDEKSTPSGPTFLVHDVREQSPKSLSLSELSEIWSGELFAINKKSGFIAGVGKEFNISWFLPSLIKYKKLFAEVIVASFFLQLFALLTPLFFQVVMDKVLVHQGFTTLDVLAVGFFVVIVFDAILGGIRNYLFSHTTNRVDVELGSKLYQHLMSLPLSYFESRQVGQNVARVRELDSIRDFITGTALTLVIDLFFVMLFLIVMWFYSSTLTYIVLATIPAYVILSIYITPILQARLQEKFQHGAANTAFLTESMSGISTVKSSAVEPQMRRMLEDHLSKYVTASFKSQNVNNIANQIAGFVNKLMTLGIIWWGAHLVIAGSLTVGQLVAFNMLAMRISSPILKLVQLWQDFQQAGISLARLGDILNTPTESRQNPNRSRLPRIQGAIELERVNFRYNVNGPKVLEDINLRIRPGEVIGIVGRSGSGKSTITKLLQRLYLPEAGRVRVDGVDLSTIDTVWLRRQIGVVLQEDFLFNRTVRENIALIDPSLPMEKVVAAAKISGAHEFIVKLPDGYDSVVGEKGANLSGGQRQRLAIARAIINNPRILIMDEATSALDYESEEIIQTNMAAICRNRTVIVIAHRLSAIKHCSRILVMERGVIVEDGSHSELLSKHGYYAKLSAHQSTIRTGNTGNIVVAGELSA